MKSNLLTKTALILIILVLFFGGIYYAAPFFKPLAVAFLIALLVLPVARKAERFGASRLWGSIAAMTVATLFLAIIFGLFAYQANKMSDNSDQLEEKGRQKIEELKSGILQRTGITPKQLDATFEKIGHSKIQSTAKNIASGILSSITDLFLTFVYAYLFLYYRSHLKRFILKLVSNDNRTKARDLMEDSADVALQYLAGKFMLIGMLAVIYAIGLTLLGVKYGIFYGVLAALLSLIPFIGNMIGAMFPIIMAVVYNDTTTALGVIILFGVAQFIESYLLQPLVVGKKVNINPMMTILIAVLGGMLWGVPGMIVAIPYLGIIAIIFSRIEELKPIGFLLSNEEEED